ncbi:MAG: hypothetical protein AAF616_10120 [Bacteroidota bacterium]
MSYEVNWTDEAKLTFNNNLKYLSEEWDLLTINKFLDRVDEVETSISQNPNLYPIYRKSDQTHKCVLNRHMTLYYRVVSSTQIDFITFWNSHKNPKNLKV